MRRFLARAATLLTLIAAFIVPSPAWARLLVPMDQAQTDHLRAYGLTYWALSHGLRGEWLLNYRGGAFLLPDNAQLQSEAVVRGVSDRGHRRSRGRADHGRDRRQQHGGDQARDDAARRGLRPAERAAVGRRGAARARLRADSVHEALGRRGAGREALRIRLAPSPPRGLHGAVREVLRRLRRHRLVPPSGRRERGDGEVARLHQGLRAEEGCRADHQDVRREWGLPLRDVLGHGYVRHRARVRGNGHRGAGVRPRRVRPQRQLRSSTSHSASRSRTSSWR